MRHFLISLDERKREREMDPPPSGAWRIKINVNTAYSPVSYVYFRSALVSVNFISFYFIFLTGGKKSRSFKEQRDGCETVLEERLNLEIRCKL